MASVSNQQQQMAALAQYQLHVQAAVQVGKTASDTLPFIGGAPIASVRHPPLRSTHPLRLLHPWLCLFPTKQSYVRVLLRFTNLMRRL